MIGSGRQPLPWIHIDDMVGIILHVLDDPRLDGRFNAVAPGIVDNATFIHSFARHLHRRVAWHMPAGLVRRIVGAERSSIRLEGQRVRPKRILASGFVFRFPDIETAMTDVVKITV